MIDMPMRKKKAPAQQRADHPGPKFWLKTDDATGEELAFEREPELPHLTISVIAGGLFEKTVTATRRVRDAFRAQGWESSYSRGEWHTAWRRQRPNDWQQLGREEASKSYPGLGRVWRRRQPIIERIEGEPR